MEYIQTYEIFNYKQLEGDILMKYLNYKFDEYDDDFIIIKFADQYEFCKKLSQYEIYETFEKISYNILSRYQIQEYWSEYEEYIELKQSIINALNDKESIEFFLENFELGLL